jgi:hypothetical protein
MPVTTTNNINTLFVISFTYDALRLTIEDIDVWAKKYSKDNAYPTFSSFLERLKT